METVIESLHKIFFHETKRKSIVLIKSSRLYPICRLWEFWHCKRREAPSALSIQHRKPLWFSFTGSFSNDVTSANDKESAAMNLYRKNPVGTDLFSHIQTYSCVQQICIVCWPCEWKAFIRSFHMTSRRPYSCTKKWNSAMFVRLAKKSSGGGGIEFLFHVKTCICSKTFAQLLATWIVRKWVPRRSFYLRHSLRLDIHRLVVLLFLLKTGLEAKYALTKYCLIYEQECSIRFKTQGLGLIKRELVVNQTALKT